MRILLRNLRLLAVTLPGALLCACRGSERPLRLGASLTVQQSGALAVLESLWTGAPLAVALGPSGQILRAAADGNLDVVITQAPTLEARLLGDARAVLRCPLVASRFVLVGPSADPARVAGAPTPADAFRRIAQAGEPFVSRGDSSGTHVKELELWRAAGVDPRGHAWYLESGADQPTTLRIADERDGYALADLPTFIKVADLRLRVLLTGDTGWENPYTLYVVRVPQPHPAALAFASWAVHAGRAGVLGLRLPDGTPAFHALAGDCATPE